VTVGAVAAGWLWAALSEKAMPSRDKAKRLIANLTKIMTLTSLFDVAFDAYNTVQPHWFCDRGHVWSLSGLAWG
jgi:hypothetical protein